MKNNKDYSHLLDRIRRLDTTRIENMSPEVIANLTDGFIEPLIREMLYTETMNHGQRRIIRALKIAYKKWKMDTDQFWGNPPLFPERYPQYLEELQMDIECGFVVTAKGTFEEEHARLKISSIPSGAVPVKPNLNMDQSIEQRNRVDTMNNNTQDADDKDKLISELRETISQMKAEFEQYKQEHSITQEQLDAIFPINSSKYVKSEIIEDDNLRPNLHEGQKITEDNAPLHAEIAELKKELGNKNQLLEDSQQRIKELEAQVEELQHKLVESGNGQVWVDWLDNDVFTSNIKAEEIYKVLCKMPTPHLINRPRCYVLFRVLSVIGGLKSNAAQKDILKWWNAHFKCGWHDDNQFKFTDLPESIKNERDIFQWKNCKGRNAEHYHSFAQDLLKELAWNKGRGEYEIKKIFLK